MNGEIQSDRNIDILADVAMLVRENCADAALKSPFDIFIDAGGGTEGHQGDGRARWNVRTRKGAAGISVDQGGTSRNVGSPNIIADGNSDGEARLAIQTLALGVVADAVARFEPQIIQ